MESNSKKNSNKGNMEAGATSSPNGKGSVGRESILQAAETLFIDRGFDGVSINDVAEKAGVAKALVFYHFHNKNELFNTVLHRYYREQARVLKSAIGIVKGSIREKLHAGVDAYLDFITANPGYPRLIQGEICTNTRGLEKILEHMEPLHHWGENIFGENLPARGPLSPRHLFISVFGMMVTYFTYTPVTRELWQEDPMSRPAMEERREHIHWVVEAILRHLELPENVLEDELEAVPVGPSPASPSEVIQAERRSSAGSSRQAEAKTMSATEAAPGVTPAGERITRLRRRYCEETPKISVERARYYTEKWQETESSVLSPAVRVALSMKHVYENMKHFVNPEDKLAGYWTESFLGIPIMIERGEYNRVLQYEMDKYSMLTFRVKAMATTLSYLLKKRQLGNFLHNLKLSREAGAQALNIGIETMTEREKNRYAITKEERRELQKKLLPYWDGKTLTDRLEKELYESGLMKGDMRQFSMALPANTSRQINMISPCANIATIQGHVIIDYEKVLKYGLLAMKEEVKERINQADSRTPGERDFLESLKIALEGTIIFAERLAAQIETAMARETDPILKDNLRRVLENCRRVPLRPARSFHEAVQAAWTVKTAVELALPTNLHCLGRMDQIFYPYYMQDIRSGNITREEAREILSELLLKTMSQNMRPESNILSNFYHRYLGSTPVTLGGLKPNGNDGTNELTYLFLEAANESRAVTNVSVRIHRNTPDELLLKLAEILSEGCSNISLFNDEINIEAMNKRGFTTPDAQNYAVTGCVELLSPGKTGAMSATSLLLNRLLDMTLRNGSSQTLISHLQNVGLKTGDPDSFRTFEQFLDAFMEQAKYQIMLIVEAANSHDGLYREMLPAPYISAFMEGCLDKGKDVTAGGAPYDLTGISFINSIANLVDSLLVIKKLIFERKELTFRELLEAIDHNFSKHQKLYRKIINIEGKWGNGSAEADELARHITHRLFAETYKYKNYRGGPVVPYVISMTTHTIDGRISIASPDGRRAATPYAASCNPYNVETGGITGTMKSVAAIDFTHVPGCAVNMKFHPSAIGKSDYSRKKWVHLLRTYFALGGSQLQPTVASADTLRAAQENPEDYRDLIIKVGGYSTYFVDLGREIQAEVIARTEHSVVN